MLNCDLLLTDHHNDNTVTEGNDENIERFIKSWGEGHFHLLVKRTEAEEDRGTFPNCRTMV